MSLVMVESCSVMGSQSGYALMKPQWNSILSSSFGSGQPLDRQGGYGYWPVYNATPSGTYYDVATADRDSTMTLGFAYRGFGAVAVAPALLVYFTTPGGASDVIALRQYGIPGGNGTQAGLQVFRPKDGVVLWDSGTALLDSVAWYYIEVKIVVHATAGSVEVRTNEVVRCSLTNIDTTPAAGSQIGRVGLYSTNIILVDDIYLNNSFGSVNNSFYGDTLVYPLFPTATGDLTQFTPTPTASPNWANVDDHADTADYNDGNTATFTDLYNFADLPAAAAGKAVFGLVNYAYVKATALPRSGALVTRLSTLLETEGATNVLTTTNTAYQNRQETKPGGGAWTYADVNTAQHGVRVKT